MQSDEPDGPTEISSSDRKDKKSKKKRDKGSKGKGKRKGKGKKGSRKKKHEEEDLEEGFLRVSTTPPAFLPQEASLATELPGITSTIDTIITTDVYVEMPTHEPDSITEAPTVVPSALPESVVTAEVEQFTCRCPPPPPSPLQF